MNRQVLLGVALGFVAATLLFALLRRGAPEPAPAAQQLPAAVELAPDRPRVAPLPPEVRVRQRYPGDGTARIPGVILLAPDAG